MVLIFLNCNLQNPNCKWNQIANQLTVKLWGFLCSQVDKHKAFYKARQGVAISDTKKKRWTPYDDLEGERENKPTK